MKKLLLSACVILTIFVVAELVARGVFPEFRDDTHGDYVTRGIHMCFGKFCGLPVRVPYTGFEFDKTKPLILILGDSITWGFGTAYEDTYHAKLQRLLRMEGSELEVIPLGGYGNNLADSLEALEHLIGQEHLTIRTILYQFNFNDVIPYSAAEIKTLIPRGIRSEMIEFLIGYGFRLVLVRAAYYGREAWGHRANACGSMGALGSYTWTFGAKGFTDESERNWSLLENNLGAVKRLATRANADLRVFMSPLEFDVDTKGVHKHFNHMNANFSCATIDPRARLRQITSRNGVELIDPTPALRAGFERRVAEGNVPDYYFPGDENHFTPAASGYIAEEILKGLHRRKEGL